MRFWTLSFLLVFLVCDQSAQSTCSPVADVQPGTTMLSGCRINGTEALNLNGDTLLVGNPLESRVFVFIKDAGTWQLMDSIQPSVSDPNDRFGAHLVVVGNILAIAAPKADGDLLSNSGVVYVFRSSSSGYVEEARLVPDQEVSNGDFGAIMDMDLVPGIGMRIAVGQPEREVDGESRAGAVCYFDRIAGAWSYSGEKETPFAKSFGRYGSQVTLDGKWLAVGSPIGNPGSSPATFLYRYAAGSYVRHDDYGQLPMFMDKGMLTLKGTIRYAGFSDYLTSKRLMTGDRWIGESFLPSEPYRCTLKPTGSGKCGWNIPNVGGIAMDGGKIYVADPTEASDRNATSGVVAVFEPFPYECGIRIWRLTDMIYPNDWYANTDYPSPEPALTRDFGRALSVSNGVLAATAYTELKDETVVLLYQLDQRCRAPFVGYHKLAQSPDSLAFEARWTSIPEADTYRFGIIWGKQDNNGLDWTTSDTVFTRIGEDGIKYDKYTWRVQSRCGSRVSDYRRLAKFYPDNCTILDSTWLSYDSGTGLNIHWAHDPILAGTYGALRVRIRDAFIREIETIEVPDPSVGSVAVPEPPSGEYYNYSVGRICPPPVDKESAAYLLKWPCPDVPPPLGNGYAHILDGPAPQLDLSDRSNGWRLYSIDGRLLRKGRDVFQSRALGLAPGVYIVQKGDRAWKVFLPN
jgi:hypothetical protein